MAVTLRIKPLSFALPLLMTSIAWAAEKPDAAGVEFFEKKIRPVLVQHCYSCHSAEAAAKNKLKGKLYLDSRAGLLAGGDTGPALAPGKEKESLLLKALRYEDDLEMPPKGKLPDAVIADFEKWIEMGAPDPRGGAAASTGKTIDIAKGREFWAYQLPKKHEPPAVKDAAWPANAIDRFILARLESAGLTPSPAADKATLVRRLYFDLIGLPPTPAQIDAFVSNAAPDAYDKLVDELLASPHFGERWGRHWLDVARFGESLTLRGFIMKDAWRYRDYVIDAFNADLPYDRFIREQIAGDLMPAAALDERRRQMVATTFLAVGNTNLEEQDKKTLVMDYVDEQLDTLGKAFLGQTIGCARCHDHKFDPIPTLDYYALAGILRSSKALEHSNVSAWINVPLPMEPAREAEIKTHEAQVAALQTKIKELKGLAAKTNAPKELPPNATPKAIAVASLPGVVVDDAKAKKVGDWKESKHVTSFVGDGYIHDENAGKGEKTLTFNAELPAAGKYEVRFAYTPGDSRSSKVPVTVFSADGEKTIEVDQKQVPALDGHFVSLGQFNFEKNGQSFVIVSNEGTTGHVIADAVQFIPVDQLADAAATGTGAGAGQAGADKAKPRKQAGAKDAAPDSKVDVKDAAEQIKQMEAELKKLQDAGPKRDTIVSVTEPGKGEDCPIHVRGSVGNLGDIAPRGFLQVANYDAPVSMPKDQSGRLQLADWLASRRNPLTARVMANRAWHWLFGAGIVRTVDNFGTTGEFPSHPELLDTLAVQFMDDEWSVKKLVKSMVMSRTYRQGQETKGPRDQGAVGQAAGPSGPTASDPENRLLSHMPRRRLDAECIRDAILSVSGKLDLTRGGRTFAENVGSDFAFQHKDTRRSVYAPVFRNSLPELFDLFDFADPSMTTGRRNVSTVAPQALYLLNHPFIVEHSRAAAQRLLAEKDAATDAARLDLLYRRALGRLPSDGERTIATKHLAGAGNAADKWAMLCQALFASMDFRYVQ